MKKQAESAELRVLALEACEALKCGHYEVLSDERLLPGVANHLLELLKNDQSALLRLLEALAGCSGHADKLVCRNSCEILSQFLRSKRSSNIPASHLRLLAHNLCSTSESPLGQSRQSRLLISSLLRRLIDLRLWGDVEGVLGTIAPNSSQPIATSGDSEGFSGAYSAEFVSEIVGYLIGAFAKSKLGDRQRIKSVLHIFGETAAIPLIEELFRHPDKEVRIALFEVIPRKPNFIIPAILKRLAVKQPWYVLRNAILILALLADSGVFCLVKPYLRHPDHRVQKAVIDFIALVGSDEICDDLIDAILVVDDRLLPGLVLLLQQHPGDEVEAAFLALLSDRHQIIVSVRDEVVIRLCESGRLPNVPKTFRLLDQILVEEEYGVGGESQVGRAAEMALRSLAKKELPGDAEEL